MCTEAPGLGGKNMFQVHQRVSVSELADVAWYFARELLHEKCGQKLCWRIQDDDVLRIVEF